VSDRIVAPNKSICKPKRGKFIEKEDKEKHECSQPSRKNSHKDYGHVQKGSKKGELRKRRKSSGKGATSCMPLVK